MKAFWAIVRRDLKLAFRRGGDAANVVVFFILTVTLFPFGIGPEAAILARVAPGVIWVVALLAAMLSLDRLFRDDHDDGSLEVLALSTLPLEVVVMAKCLAHWLTTGLLLVIAAPLQKCDRRCLERDRPGLRRAGAAPAEGSIR